MNTSSIKLRTLLSGVFFILIYSCDPCHNPDCFVLDSYLKLEIVDLETRNNLFFGPNAEFSHRELKSSPLSVRIPFDILFLRSETLVPMTVIR